MSVILKTPQQIDSIRAAGKVTAMLLDWIEPFVEPGITTEKLDELIYQQMTEVHNVIPATLGYRGFPKSICTSINHQVCHGIPADRVLKDGDIVNIDITSIKDGWHGDASRMYYVGNPNIAAKRLCEVAYDCLYKGIDCVKPGGYLCEIGQAITQHAHANRCSVVRDYCGHGIGQNFHESPQVLHYCNNDKSIQLQPGMTFTIEPMINLGKEGTKVLKDKWTVVTRDRSLSAQWEHTLAVTDTGYDILTLA